jgi:AraC-like DNA-binding protein
MTNGFDPGCGVLGQRAGQYPGRHVRYAAKGPLCDWIEHFWIQEWDTRQCGPQQHVMLPHPYVHLVFAAGRSRVYGVQRGRFLRELKGRDRIVGVRFRPGAFYSIFRKPVVELADSSLPAADVFSDAVDTEHRILACGDDTERIAVISEFLSAKVCLVDTNARDARCIVEWIAADRCATRVSHVVERFGLSVRSLQRLFARYVGASPRWIIRHYRIHELLKLIGAGEPIAWASLAQSLGYFDQSHLINDFEQLVGSSPARYASVSALIDAPQH